MASRRRGDDGETARIPLPIQTFLWRQTSPFLRPKLSKQCDASCLSFEHIVVQNIHHGLSPSLCEALQATPRWLFVQTAFPHIAHCCAAILRGPQQAAGGSSTGGGSGNASGGGGSSRSPVVFSSMEAKLLYALHWALLDAAAECDASASTCSGSSAGATYPLSSVQLFVYLFAPLLRSMQPESFHTLKLESGLRIWQPLWDYQMPSDVPAFCALAKPKRSRSGDAGEDPVLRQRAQTMSANEPVYVGGSAGQGPELPEEALPSEAYSASSAVADAQAATFFDVAVLQCLTSQRWAKEGRLWALRYLDKRLEAIATQQESRAAKRRARSSSVPLPIIKVSTCGSVENGLQQDLFSPATEGCNEEDAKMPRSPREAAFCVLPPHLPRTGFKELQHARARHVLVPTTIATTTASAHSDSASGNSAPSVQSNGSPSPAEHQVKAAASAALPPPAFLGITGNSAAGSQESAAASVPSPRRLSGGTPVVWITPPEETAAPEAGIGGLHGGQPDTPKKPLGNTTVELPAAFPSRRSKSEPCITVDAASEFQEEAIGSMHYIQENGMLNYVVLLKAVHQAVLVDTSHAVCLHAVSIVRRLLHLGAMGKQCRSGSQRESACKKVSNWLIGDSVLSGSTNLTENKSASLSNRNRKAKACEELYQLALDAVIEIIITIGCSFCSHYTSDTMAEVREQAVAVLTDLYELRPSNFRASMRTFVTSANPCEQVLRFFHAYAGYCRSTDDSGQHGSPSVPAAGTAGTSGYATNFGQSISGEGHRGIEGVVLALTLGTLVTRLVPTVSDLSKPRNVTVYGDARKFLSYCQRYHGGTLHRVALSGLIDIASQSAKRASKASKNRASADASSPAESPSVEHSPTSELKGTLQKDASTDGSLTNVSLAPQRGKAVLELPRNLQRRHSVPDRMQDSSTDLKVLIPENLGPNDSRIVQDSPGPAVSVASAMSSQSDEDITFDDGEVTSKGFSFRVVSQATLALVKARRRVKERLKLISSKQRLQEAARSEKVMRRRSTGDCVSPRPLSETSDKESQLIDIRALAGGMSRFHVLLNMCEPGTFPEPEFLAALLDLDAPVIGRACVLLECAYFVHHCNSGDWPPWMRGYISGGSGRALAPAAFKKSVTLQRTAALRFYKWAEAVGARLEELLEQNSFDMFTVVTAADFEFRVDENEEDYLVEVPAQRSSASPGGGACPAGLRSIACLLLMEITSFLRESYQHMPVAHPRAVLQGPHFRSGRSAAAQSAAGSGGVPISPGHSLNSDHVRSASPTLDGTESGRSQRGMASAAGILGSATSLNSMDATAAAASAAHRKSQGRVKKTSLPGIMQPSLKAKRSIKLKRNEGWKSSTRKVSSFSQHEYLCSEDSNVFVEEDEELAETDPVILEIYDDLHNKMSWMKIMIKIMSLSNFVCKHGSSPSASSSLSSAAFSPGQGCHPLCYSRQCQSTRLLAAAISRVYAPRACITASANTSATQQHQVFSCRPSATHVSSSEKRPSLTKLVKSSSSSILLLNVMESMGGTRRKSIDRLLPAALQSPTMTSDSAPQTKGEQSPVATYMKKHANNLMIVPLTLLTKGAAQLSNEDFSDTVTIAWELLLQDEQETAAAAASFILIAALQVPATVQALIIRELSHAEPSVRLDAISKFNVLWQYRHQVWCRLEPGASSLFKVPPPSIDYTLPSPPLGLPEQIVADAPWRPHLKLKLEELAANQEKTKSLVTATNTRRKQQQEMIAKALVAEEISKREARELYPYSTAAITLLASATHGVTVSSAAHKAEEEEGFEDTGEPSQSPKEVVHPVFPSCLCLIGLHLLDLIDDRSDTPELNGSCSAVSRAAERVLWQCIIEDPSLFLRYPFERLTHVDQQDRVFGALRRLVLHYPRLPANVAYVLFNNLIGYVLFYDRFPHDVSLSATCKALSILWQLVPSVHGLSFKNLKSTLKKVQSEPTLMVTAHLPCTKKIIVHGPDQTLPPQQFIVHEDTQFLHILNESLDYFNVADNHNHYYLLDIKSGQMHNKNNYVRDFYVFRRTNVPQLRLTQMNPDVAFSRQQKQALDMKFVEIGRILLTSSILKHTSSAQMENHVLFLHEEFLKQLAFPRRALETEFAFHKGGGLGHEMLVTDKIHKLTWLQFLETFFLSMPGSFGWMNEMQLFLNVINGVLILHCEDHGMLRRCLALYISSAYHFKQVYSNDGFLKILPTVLRVYGTYQGHEKVRNALEFVHKQFYILHRKAYLLQLLGSAEPFLSSTARDVKFKDTHLFRLLCVLEEKNIADELDILDFVHAKKPLRAMDFCYEADDEFKVLHAINSGIAVITYATESYRATQMLCLLDALMPLYVEHVSESKQQRGEKVELAKAEAERFENLAHSIKVLVSGCELLSRNLNVAQHRYLEGASSTGAHGKRTQHYHDDVEDSVISARHLEEGRYVDEDAEMQSTTREFRRPRDALLSLVATFVVAGSDRLKANKKHLSDTSYRNLSLLDAKSHEQLAEIAHSLLKVGTYDPVTMAAKGLQRYVTEILPLAEWSADTSGATRRPANVIVKRLERIFVKVQKRNNIRSAVDWDACATLIRGICCTLELHPTLHHAQHLKNLVHTCVGIVLQDGVGSTTSAGNLTHHRPADQWQNSASSPNHEFCSVVAKLAAGQALATGEVGGLEHLCTSTVQFPLGDHSEAILVNFFLPLCLRVGGCRKECQRLLSRDVHFMLSFVLLCLNPQSKYAMLLRPAGGTLSNNSAPTLTITTGSGHYGSQQHQGASASSGNGSELLQKAALLSLKVLTTCFPDQLNRSWWIIAQSVVEAIHGNGLSRLTMWKFLDFVVAARNPLFPMLKPYIVSKFLSKRLDSDQEYVIQHRVRQRLAPTLSNNCYSRLLPHRTQLLKEFSAEIQKLRYALSKNDMFSPRSLSAKSSKGWKRKVSLITRMTSEEAATATHPQLNVMSVREPKEPLLLGVYGRVARSNATQVYGIDEDIASKDGSFKVVADKNAENIRPQSSEKLHRHGAFYQPPAAASVAACESSDELLSAVTPSSTRRQIDAARRKTFKSRRFHADGSSEEQLSRPLLEPGTSACISGAPGVQDTQRALWTATAGSTVSQSPRMWSGFSASATAAMATCLEPVNKDTIAIVRAMAVADKSRPPMAFTSEGNESANGAKTPRSIGSVSSSRSDRILHIDTSSSDEDRKSDITLHVDV